MNEILVGDVIDKLREIPEKSIDTVVTSVPFFGVRNYDVEGQWGLENDINGYLINMVSLMQSLDKVLKDTGSVWIEIGDKRDKDGWMDIPERFKILVRGAPEWRTINKIIWEKRNAMPLSTKKMFSPKYTNIYGMHKKDFESYFDLDAVRVPVETPWKDFNVRRRDTNKPKFLQKASDKEKRQDATIGVDGKPLAHYVHFNRRYDHEKLAQKGKNPGNFWSFDVFDITVKPFKGLDHYATFPPEIPERIIKATCPPRICSSCEYPDSNPNILGSSTNTNGKELLQKLSEKNSNERRSPSSKTILFKKMLQSNESQIKATSKYELERISDDLEEREVCNGTQINNRKEITEEITSNRSSSSYKWNKNRQQNRKFTNNDDIRTQSAPKNSKKTNSMSTLWKMDEKRWSCKKCGNHDFHPGVVLDCFMGSGTTGLVAKHLGFNWMGIELKKEFADFAMERIND